MSPNLNKQLHDKYPKLCENMNKSPQKTCFSFWCECDDGWFSLIDQLLGFIQGTVDSNHKYCKKGDAGYIERIKVAQIKEKFGKLRIYIDNGSEEVIGAILFAEYLSGFICEECGSTKNVGTTTNFYIKTVCINCVKDIKNWKQNQ